MIDGFKNKLIFLFTKDCFFFYTLNGNCMKLIVESGCLVCIYLTKSEERKHLRDFRLPLTLTEIYKMST